MSIVTRNLGQDVTVWRATPTGFGGYVFASPEHAKGRWEGKAVLFRTPSGEEQTSNAFVYLNADVAVGDYLYLGISEAASPIGLAGSRQVRQFFSTPDLRNKEVERKAIL